jgi:hypothetical protein
MMQSMMQNMNQQMQTMNYQINSNVNNQMQGLNRNMNQMSTSFSNGIQTNINTNNNNVVSTSVSYDPINRETVVTINRNGIVSTHRVRDGENSNFQINQLINTGFVPNTELINALPEREIAQSDLDSINEQKSCIICLAQYQLLDKVITLPCLHIFHSDCIRTWLDSRDDCPICKHKINEMIN